MLAHHSHQAKLLYSILTELAVIQAVTSVQSEAVELPEGQSLQRPGGEQSDSVWDQWQRIGFVAAHAASGHRESSNGNPGNASKASIAPCIALSIVADLGGRDTGAASACRHEVISSSADVTLETRGAVLHTESPFSGVERGSCGVWNVSYDEGAAQRTVKKLALSWHRQDFRGHRIEQGAAGSSGERVAEPGTSAGSGSAGHTDSQKLSCPNVNSSCAHTACAAKVTF